MSRDEQQQFSSKHHQQQPSTARVKPAIPMKPINIPPPPAVLVASAGERPILKGDYRKCNFIRAESMPTSTAKCQKTVAQKYKDQRSASPNISCANDCCGMSWTPGPPTPPVTNSHTGVGGGNNNNSMANKNNNNNNSSQDTSEDNEHRSTKYQNSVTFNESFDSSSESSNSGGFRDPEFQAKQAQAYESTPPVVRNDYPAAPQTKIESFHNTSQYHKSSKQLEHLLAQRIDKEIRLKGGPSSTASTAAATPIANNKRISTHSASMDEVDDSSAMSTMQRQFVQKLQEELKNKSKDIQQKHLIERRLPQEHYKPICADHDLVKLEDVTVR
jgi:hypothetical protein